MMKQISIELADYGWFASLPVSSYEHANVFYNDLKLRWKQVEIIKKGNGWIVRYRNGGEEMKISRWNADFGNSICQQMINGTYFEFPSSIYEISEKDANSLFTEGVDHESLINHLVLKTRVEGKDRYFKVGEKAKNDILSNNHIAKLHDKTESLTVYISWLAGMAFYHAYKNPGRIHEELVKIEVEYFKTLLPVWLVKRAGSFSAMLDKMATRFKEVAEVELLTPHYQRKLQIQVLDSKCRLEGETARFSLMYDLELNEKMDFITKFKDARAVIDDLGGQTEDLVKLRPGLKRPENADDFQSFTDQSYLQMIENLRTTKLMTHFTDLRSLEQFIARNISTRQYIYVDPTTQESEDFTGVINDAIREFIKISVNKLLTTFSFLPGEKVFFVHIGGVNELLKAYKTDYLTELLGEEIVRDYHIFPEESRKLNIYSLEIVTKSEVKKREEQHEKESI